MEDMISVARTLGWCWCWSVRHVDDHLDLDEFVTERPHIFWIMGADKTGKTKLAELLAAATSYELIKLPHLIKLEAAKDDYRSQIIASCVQQKKPILDEVVIAIIKEQMHKTKTTAKGYIIDNFPIDLKQAKLFEFEIHRPTILIYTRLPADHALITNSDVDYLSTLNEFHKLHYKYEMKTLKVVMSDKPQVLCDKLVEDLNEYWGYSFRKKTDDKLKQEDVEKASENAKGDKESDEISIFSDD